MEKKNGTFSHRGTESIKTELDRIERQVVDIGKPLELIRESRMKNVLLKLVKKSHTRKRLLDTGRRSFIMPESLQRVTKPTG
jgi:hypothetical protein